MTRFPCLLPNVEMLHWDVPIEHCMGGVSCSVGPRDWRIENIHSSGECKNAKGSRVRILVECYAEVIVSLEPSLEMHVAPTLCDAK